MFLEYCKLCRGNHLHTRFLYEDKITIHLTKLQNVMTESGGTYSLDFKRNC